MMLMEAHICHLFTNDNIERFEYYDMHVLIKFVNGMLYDEASYGLYDRSYIIQNVYNIHI